jgi:hypothetical protein
MSHFAQINGTNVVVQVIVAEQDVIDTGLFGNPSSWVQTSYNTYAGQHLLGGTPLRKNYAGVGYTYDPIRDAFIPPKPYPSWVLDEDTCQWNSPTPKPQDGSPYQWNEETLQWDLVESPMTTP